MDILGNNIGDEQANNLIQLLDNSNRLTTLCGFTGTENELNLSNRNLSASCAILVANEVKLNRALVSFIFSGDARDSKPATLTVEMTEADLSGKKLRASGAILAAAYLERMT